MQATKNINSLPLPRLEFNWVKEDENSDSWEERICLYQLVLPIDKCDIRSGFNEDIDFCDEWRVDIGQTHTSGMNKPISNGKVDTPFRDYSHMQIDNLSLGNLPMYAVCEDVYTLIEKSRQISK